jgi:hypothetical protein
MILGTIAVGSLLLCSHMWAFTCGKLRGFEKIQAMIKRVEGEQNEQ